VALGYMCPPYPRTFILQEMDQGIRVNFCDAVSCLVYSGHGKSGFRVSFKAIKCHGLIFMDPVNSCTDLSLLLMQKCICSSCLYIF
jgi:hypothetical protein